MILSYETREIVDDKGSLMVRPMHSPKNSMDVQDFARIQMLETERDNIVSFPKWMLMTKKPKEYNYLWFNFGTSPSQCR